MKTLSKIFFLSFLLSSQTQAAILIEPLLGYRLFSGEAQQTFSNTQVDTLDYTYHAPLFGARLGYQTLGLTYGLDFSLSPPSQLKQELITNGATTYQDLSQNQIGLFIGYYFPLVLPLNLRGSYIVSSTLDNESSDFSGSGFGLGFGLSAFVPLLRFNFDYKKLTYERSPLGNSGDWEVVEYNVTVSYPFNFF